MKGIGILRGLGVTLKHFFATYTQDFKRGSKYYYTDEGVEDRRSSKVGGAFSVQYPDEKLPVPEEFRFLPFLVYEEKENGERDYRCTACGICSKACPPQCIWIVRATDPVTGKPVTSPAEYYIDMDVCMNCGFCAEYCPFDAIKMDHDYEIAVYEREHNIYNLQKLGKPVSYYASIRPKNFAAEEEERLAKEAAKQAKKAAA